MKTLYVFVSLMLAGCTGGGGDEFDYQNLSGPPALKLLHDSMVSAKKKGEFESTAEFDRRFASYVAGLNGYHSTLAIRTSYDADAQELKIHTLPESISEGIWDYETTFYTGHTSMRIENSGAMYTPVTREETCYNGNPCQRSYYKIIPADPAAAQRIIDGFRMDYTHTFNADQVRRAGNTCAGAYWTNCTNHLYGNAGTFRVYNVVNGLEY